MKDVLFWIVIFLLFLLGVALIFVKGGSFPELW